MRALCCQSAATTGRGRSGRTSIVALVAFAAAGFHARGQTDLIREDRAVVARVGKDVVTVNDLASGVQSRLYALRREEYEIEKQDLQLKIDDLLLRQGAARAGVDVTDFLAEECEKGISYPTDVEAAAVFDAFPEQYALDDRGLSIRTIKRLIWDHRVAERKSELLKRLRTESGAVILLEPPRLDVSALDAAHLPSRGAPGARVTIVEVGDFQCPYCYQVQRSLAQLGERYSMQVRFKFLHFPLPLHKDAENAAEAAVCADRQGRFFEMHDRLFQGHTALSPDDLRGYAAEVGLDVPKFTQCVGSEETTSKVKDDMRIAANIGVVSTPSFLINGRLVVGALSYKELAGVVEEELASVK